MKLDYVHDLQKVYRTLVSAFSFPGRSFSIGSSAEKLDIVLPFPAAFGVVALTLLDRETSFSCPDQDRDAVASAIVNLCSADPVSMETAAFVLLPFATEDLLTDSVQGARRGTLEDPHLGATILVDISKAETRRNWVARGPGIQDFSIVSLPWGSRWIDERAKALVEFPLGVDLVFVDAHGDLMALPRTTRLEED